MAWLNASLSEPVRLGIDDHARVGGVGGDEVDGADPPAARLEVRDHRGAEGAAAAVDQHLLRHDGSAGDVEGIAELKDYSEISILHPMRKLRKLNARQNF